MNAFADISRWDRPPALPDIEYRGVCGTGSMAVVWHARQLALDRDVAVKVLRHELMMQPEERERFLAGGRVMSRFNHPCLPRCYGVFEEERPCIVMDYLDGYPVQNQLARCGRLREQDCRVILISAISALGYVWREHRLCHGDVNPANLIVCHDGTVKLVGMGALANGNGIDPLADVVGTPAYMSPEQIYGDTGLDSRADIYSLGATIYHLLTGHTLFPGLSPENVLLAHVDGTSQAPDPRLFAPEVSPSFAYLLASMLVKDRNLRMPGWEAVEAAVARLDDNVVASFPSVALSSVRLNV